MKYTLVAGVALLGATVFPPLQAADVRRATVIEEVIVTARRREETAQEVPIPITAVTGEGLRDRGAFDIRDLERLTPNLSFVNSAVAKNSAQVFLRGIGQVNWGPAQDPKVGTYLNGVYIGRPQGGIFDLLDIERVEVLRGPQGTLFGRNTTAGLIHVITKEPTQEFEATVKVGAGKDGQLLAAGTLNVPITDELAVRMAVQHREADGYVKNTFDGSEWNDANSQNGRVTMLWQPRADFEASLGFDFQRVREKPGLATCNFIGPENGAESLATGSLLGFAYIFGTYDAIRDNCKAQGYLRSFEDDPDDRSDIDAYGVALTLKWDIEGIGELSSITSFRDMDEINGSWGNLGDSIAGDVLAVRQPPGTTNTFSQWSQEFRLSGTLFDDKLDWVGGVYVFSEDARQFFDVPLLLNMVPPDCAVVPQFCIDLGGGLTFGALAQSLQIGFSNTLDYDATNKSRAIFAEGTYHFNQRLALTAGIRYTKDERDLSLQQTLIGGAVDPSYMCPDGTVPVNNKCSRSSPDYDEFTPRAILSYQLTDDILVYGGWSKGYSSGGLNQTPRLEDYLPEVSKNWEVGLKSNLFDRRVQFNATAFHNTYENQQISVGRVIDMQTVVAVLNAQEATLYGAEMELTVVPAEGWLISAVAGIFNGEYDEFEITDVSVGPAPQFVETVITNDIKDDAEVVLGSPYTYSLSVAKSLYFNTGDSVTGQVGWSFRGRRYDDLFKSPDSRQAKYGLLDARATWQLRNGNTAVSFWGTNLLDRKYTLSRGANGDPNQPPTILQLLYWGQPRRFGVEVTHAFDNG